MRIDGLEADITPEQWQGLTDSFDSVRASLGRLEDNLGRAAGGLRATQVVLAGGAVSATAAFWAPVATVYAGGAAVAGGLVLSGAKRWNDGQATIDVVVGAAADTTGVTSFSLGLWGRDPVTSQEVPLTPEQGTYELIVGASSISMLVGMPFANGLRGPTTSIPVPKPQLQFVESFSVVGDTLVASPVRFPTITWTKGAIEVSHQGIAIATAYAGTTRTVAMMASGPMPNGAPTPSPRSQELIDILAPGGQPIGVRLGGVRDSIRTLPVSCSRRTWNLRGQGFAFRPARSTSPAARLPRSSKRWVSAPRGGHLHEYRHDIPPAAACQSAVCRL